MDIGSTDLSACGLVPSTGVYAPVNNPRYICYLQYTVFPLIEAGSLIEVGVYTANTIGLMVLVGL